MLRLARLGSPRLLLAVAFGIVGPGVTEAAQIVGRVLQEQNKPVITEGKVAAISIGSRDGLSEGDTLTLRRGAGNLGLATAVVVFQTYAIVQIPLDRPGPEIQAGDEFVANLPDPNQLLAAPQKGHADAVRALAFSPDGKLLASGDQSGVVIVWSTADRRALYSARMGLEIAGIEFGSDDTLLTATQDNHANVKIWNLRTGRIVTSLSGHERAGAMAYFHAKSLIASSAWDRHVIVWDEHNRKELCKCSIGPAETLDHGVGFSADGAQVLAPVYGIERGAGGLKNYSAIRVWSSTNCAEVASWRMAPHSSSSMIATAGSAGLLAASQLEGRLSLWDSLAGREIKNVWLDDSLFSVAVTAKGDVVAAGGGRSVTLWYPGTGKRERIAVEKQAVESVRFSPAGNYLAWAGADNSVRLYDVAGHKDAGQFAGRTGSLEERLFPFGRGYNLAVVSDNGAVRLWDLVAGRLTPSLELAPRTSRQISVSAEGELVSVSPSGVESWGQITSARAFAHWTVAPNRRFALPAGAAKDVLLQAVSPDGRFVAMGEIHGQVSVFDRISHAIRNLNEWQGDGLGGAAVTRVSFSGDGKYLAWVNQRGDAELWSAPGFQRVTTWHHSGVGSALAFSPDSSLIATAAWDGVVIVQGTAANASRYSLPQDYGFIEDLQFSSDNSQLAGAQGRAASVWDLRTRRIAHVLNASDTSFGALAFLKPGLLVSSNHDSTLILWDTLGGERLATLVPSDKSGWLAFTPDGFFDGTPAAWNTVPFHFRSDLTALFEPEQYFNEFYQPGLVADIVQNVKSIRAILAQRGIARAKIDLAKYRSSRLPVVGLNMESSKDSAFRTRTATVRLEIQDSGSGVQDCRIFRNDGLVHFEHGVISRPSIQVTLSLASGGNLIKGYCFNRDGLKSKDTTIQIEAGRLAARPRAYIIAVGVDQYANQNFNLRFAGADAADIAQTLSRSFRQIGNFQPVPLTITDQVAIKSAILQTLAQLSGAVAPHPSPALPGLGSIAKAGPDDMVIVFFAGHGMTVGDRYYLVPHDLGYTGSRVGLSDAGMDMLKAHSISDLELQAALEKLDAGHSVLIVDACESGQVLEMEDKRLGPMNSRGLAQLAYEKGMSILSAAQTQTAARELGGEYNHGILTYALIEKGITQRKAFPPWSVNQLTERDWLDYTIDEVPALQLQGVAEVGSRILSVGGEPVVFDARNPPVQRPQVYHRDDARDGLIVVAK